MTGKMMTGKGARRPMAHTTGKENAAPIMGDSRRGVPVRNKLKNSTDARPVSYSRRPGHRLPDRYAVEPPLCYTLTTIAAEMWPNTLC